MRPKIIGMAQKAIIEQPALRGRTRVFRDRAEAGVVLSSLLTEYRDGRACVLAIPSGGVPVAVAVARELRLELGLAVVSKITLPWDTESGFGAVAFDGTVELNEQLLPHLGLTQEEITVAVERTRQKVARRIGLFRAESIGGSIAGRDVIVVDDGLASGFTMEVACRALRRAGVAQVIVAVPTAHEDAASRLLTRVDRVVGANVRAGRRFAVADAYERWYDVSEEEAANLLRQFATIEE